MVFDDFLEHFAIGQDKTKDLGEAIFYSSYLFSYRNKAK
jgi:hypothetical protein